MTSHHYNTISSKVDFGKPPAYYKEVGKPNAQGKFALQPPDLQMLTKDKKNYNLVFHGYSDFIIPLKMKNNMPFVVGPGQVVEDLSEKYTIEYLTENNIQIDSEFLKQIKADVGFESKSKVENKS